MQLSDPDLFRTQCYVNGRFVDAPEGAQFIVLNPADGSEVAMVADADAALTEQAIEAAALAFPDWRRQTAKARAAILRRWFELVTAATDDLATLMTTEQGKPLAEAKGEVGYGAGFIEWFAEEGKRVYGDVIPPHAEGKRILVTKEPVGVVGAITPWNFPIAMITRKAAAALAAGCTFVVKPAEDTPLCALALAELAQRAGIPPGVFNVVTGSRSAVIGGELTANPKVRKITFTGSTATGRRLLEQSAGTVKRTSMELGGNAPFIVFDDADLDAAVAGAVASKYRNAGQTCVCANRILVQERIHDAFVERLAEKGAAFHLGNGLDPDVTMGPLIHARAAEEVEAKVTQAIEGGAEAVIGGGRSNLGECFFEPTVLTGVDRTMRVFSEEIFGPVAPVFRFSDEDEAVAMANDTIYGLAAYLYARDVGRIFRVLEGLEYGMVAVNDGMLSTEVAPFGGVKQSGMGREGSKYGIEDYLNVKYGLIGGL